MSGWLSTSIGGQGDESEWDGAGERGERWHLEEPGDLGFLKGKSSVSQRCPISPSQPCQAIDPALRGHTPVGARLTE